MLKSTRTLRFVTHQKRTTKTCGIHKIKELINETGRRHT
jgi:hypothetical protein